MINLKDLGTNFSISDNGEIFAGDEPVARLAVAEFIEPRRLRKVAGLRFANPDAANLSPAVAVTRVRQGMLETSNVNPVMEMSDLIKAHRYYEHDLKAIKTHDALMGKEANDIGKL